MRRRIYLCLWCALFLCTSTIKGVQAQGKIKMHFINVGHADATLIEYGNEYVLIDGGIVTQSGKNESDYYTNKVSVINGVTENGKSYIGYYDLFQKCADKLYAYGGEDGWKLSKQQSKATAIIDNAETSDRFQSFFGTHNELKAMTAYQAQGQTSDYHEMQANYVSFVKLLASYESKTSSSTSTDQDLASQITSLKAEISELEGQISEDEETLSEKEDALKEAKEQLEALEADLPEENTESGSQENPENLDEEENEEPQEGPSEPEEDQTSEDETILELKEKIASLESEISTRKAALQEKQETLEKLKKSLKTLEDSQTTEASSAEILAYLHAVGYRYTCNLILDYFTIDDYTTSSANDTLRYLKKHGITHIDYVVSTHSHFDHVGGLPSVLMNLDVDHCIYNGVTYSTASYRIFEIVMRMQEEEGDLDVVLADDDSHNTFSIGHGAVKFTELTDTDSFSGRYYKEGYTNYLINNQSLVYRMDYAGVSAMLTADAEKDRQDQIREDHPDLVDVDLYKVAHHGYNNYAGDKYRYYGDSGHSANVDFVNAMTPLYSIVCAGTASSSVPSKNALADLVYSNVYVTTDQVNKVKHEAIIATITPGSIAFTDPSGKTVSPHTVRKLSYSVTASKGLPNKSNSSSSTASALHFVSTKVTYYNSQVKGEVSIKASPNYYYPQVYYQLSSKDIGYREDQWIEGQTAKLTETFYGVVYFKFMNKFGESVIRKTDGFNVKPGTAASSLTIDTFKAELYGYDDVKLSWNKVTGAKKYILQYKREDWAAYKALGTSTGTSLKHANLADGKGYDFRIKVDGSSDYTETSSMLYALKKMTAPSVKKVTTTKSAVSFTPIKGADGYQISAYTSTKKKIVATTTASSVNVTVKKNKKYYYYVRAYKTVSGKKIYAPWSASRTFTCR